MLSKCRQCGASLQGGAHSVLKHSKHRFRRILQVWWQPQQTCFGSALCGRASGESTITTVTTIFQQILSVTSDVVAAFTAALSVLNESLALATCQDKRITDLEKEQARLQALAVFRDPIEVFRDIVAEKTGRASWQRLARDLYLERYEESNLHEQKWPVPSLIWV